MIEFLENYSHDHRDVSFIEVFVTKFYFYKNFKGEEEKLLFVGLIFIFSVFFIFSCIFCLSVGQDIRDSPSVTLHVAVPNIQL